MNTRMILASGALLLAAFGCRDDTGSPTEPAPSSAPETSETAAAALSFYQVSGGDGHSCGVTADSLAYCWGYNDSGQLGTGTLTGPESCSGAVGPFACSTRPVAVAGGHRFRMVSAGGQHTCGVTGDYRLYCWGRNREGQLGDSTNVRRRTRPSRVVGPSDFRQIDAGGDHTCGVTAVHQAWCWGDGRDGELGNGRTYLSFWPRAVAGGLAFGRVSTGLFFSCGETTMNRVYCWGSNSLGELGDGTTTGRLRPVRVAGGLFFSQMDAGNWHACARTPSGAAYCWGDAFFGALGNGSSGFENVALAPVAVLGPE